MTDRHKQLDLLTLPYQRHSDTSKRAAQDALAGAVSLRAKLYRLISSVPSGLTDEQMQIALAMNASTQRPRRIELVRAGLVIDSGIRRKTVSGRLATVWTATQ